VHKEMGLVAQVFDEPSLTALRGDIAVAHCRYSTTGAPVWANAQPTFRSTPAASVALGHNGNLTNTRELAGMLPGGGGCGGGGCGGGGWWVYVWVWAAGSGRSCGGGEAGEGLAALAPGFGGQAGGGAAGVVGLAGVPGVKDPLVADGQQAGEPEHDRG